MFLRPSAEKVPRRFVCGALIAETGEINQQRINKMF